MFSNGSKRTALAAIFASTLWMTGCSADFSRVTAAPGPTNPLSSGNGLGGSVYGGQQPVSGSTVQLWAAGTSGYGSQATPIGPAVTTNSNGGFTLGSYTCPSGAYAYLTAAGGDPQVGSGTTNAAIALMAALGPCSALSTSTFININEVTTVAAVWALAPFTAATVGTPLSTTTTTPSDTVGTTSTNIQGLANAMAVASILANTTTGASPGSNATGNVSNVEYWQVNTLANILALCVNSDGVSSAPCSPVISATTVGGGTAPADTLQIALYLAQNPAKGTSLLSQISGTPPFQPYDATVNDWSIGYSVPTGSTNSRWIAFDQFGNAWVTTSGASVVELSPTGDLISTPGTYTPSGGSSTNITASYEVAVDTANNAWFTDETGHAIFEVNGSTSAGGANGGSGAAVSTTSVGTGNLEGIAVDGSNNVWASLSGKNIVGLMHGAYTTLVTGAATTTDPFGIAVDMSNQTRFGNTALSGGGSFVYALNSGGCNSGTVKPSVNGGTNNGTGGSIAMAFTAATTIGSNNYTAGSATPLSYFVDSVCNNTTNVSPNATYSPSRVFMSTPYGIAFDNNNAMWVVNQNYTSSTDNSSGHYSLAKVAPQNYGSYTDFTGATVGQNVTFTSISGTSGGMNAPFYLAMDGAGAAWVANSAGAGLSAFNNSGTAISPATGFSGGTCTTSPCSASKRTYASARGVAVDGSGNVWVANTGAAYVTVVVGEAMPTVTPLALGIKNGTLASAP